MSLSSGFVPFVALETLCLLIVEFLVGLIVNDLSEAGEFSIDLYTMPDLLTSKLWEHLVSAKWLQHERMLPLTVVADQEGACSVELLARPRLDRPDIYASVANSST